LLQATAIKITNKQETIDNNRLTIVKTVGFVFTPATSTAMSNVQIGGFYTALHKGGFATQKQKEKTMAIPYAAGGAAMKILKLLYKGKKKIGKGSSMAADLAAKKGFTKTSAAITGASQKTHKGMMATKKLAKKYPKSAAALTGAVGYDIFDND